MEILSINFAIFVAKLALCIVPVVLGIRLFILPSELKDETRKKLSKKLLGDSNLIEPTFYNFVLYLFACIFILFALVVSLLFFL